LEKAWQKHILTEELDKKGVVMMEGKGRSTIREVLTIVFCLILVPLFLSGCMGYSSTPSTTAPSTTETPTQNPAETHVLAALAQAKSTLHTTSDGFCQYIEGDITNNTGQMIGYGSISFNLFDKEGRQIGSTLDNCVNLKAGTIWHFKALIFENNWTRYQCSDFTGWYQ
jgi:hypothetical protein